MQHNSLFFRVLISCCLTSGCQRIVSPCLQNIKVLSPSAFLRSFPVSSVQHATNSRVRIKIRVDAVRKVLEGGANTLLFIVGAFCGRRLCG